MTNTKTKITSILLVIAFAFISCMFAGCFYEQTLLTTSTSPDNTYTVEAYIGNGGATTAYDIKVYLKESHSKKLIYNQYRESTVEINWIDDNIVQINDVTLDLSKGETYKGANH